MLVRRFKYDYMKRVVVLLLPLDVIGQSAGTYLYFCPEKKREFESKVSLYNETVTLLVRLEPK